MSINNVFTLSITGCVKLFNVIILPIKYNTILNYVKPNIGNMAYNVTGN